MPDSRPVDRLVNLAYQMLFPRRFPKSDTEQLKSLQEAVAHLLKHASDTTRNGLRQVRLDMADPVEANPDWLRELLVWELGKSEMFDLLAAAGIPAETFDYTLVEGPIWMAVARMAIGHASAADGRRIERWQSKVSNEVGLTTNEEGADMADHQQPYEGEYDVDTRNLPETFNREEFWAAIVQLFKDRNSDPRKNPLDRAHAAYVGGALLRSSYYDAHTPGFESAFVDEYNEGFEIAATVKEKVRTRHIDVYAQVAAVVFDLKRGDEPTIQEVAAVSDEVLDRGPVDDNFEAKVRAAHDDYVGKTPVYDSLELPDVVTDDTARAEVEPANIRAVGMVYAAGELESSQLLGTCDLAAQDWSDGVLPVGENAGRLFDAYVWNARDRLDAAARQVQFERIGELSGYILRFCSATSERDRSQYLSEYLVGGRQRTAQPRDAAVRKTARDLLAFASLHGWAYTQFAAKRLGNHIRECVEIIENAEVQKAYGVQGPWQVVERVASMTGGVAPDISKHRALASTGKAIIDLLASKSKDIAASLAKEPLFPSVDGLRSVFSVAEYEELINHVENWLAANSVDDRQRIEASQPREVSTSPSLPSFAGAGGGAGGFDSESVKNQLMQMVSAGQMPTADQVAQFFNTGS